MVETAGLQGPAGSLVVKVKVAIPVKPTGGAQVAFKVFAFGVKEPPTLEVQVALEAAPPMDPFNTKVPFIQAPLGYTPAFAVATGLKVMVV